MASIGSNKRIAFICSSAGGVMDALAQAQHEGFPLRITGMITDRACGAEHVASRWGIQQVRLARDPWETWSARAAQVLRSWKPHIVLLLFLRRIGPEIWRDIQHTQTWNLHPSILPAHPGLNSMERSHAEALEARLMGRPAMLGTTLHHVTEHIDAGPIIAQRTFSIDHAPTLERARHLSFLQKVELVLDQLGADPDQVREFIASLAQPWARSLYRPRIEEAA